MIRKCSPNAYPSDLLSPNILQTLIIIKKYEHGNVTIHLFAISYNGHRLFGYLSFY